MTKYEKALLRSYERIRRAEKRGHVIGEGVRLVGHLDQGPGRITVGDGCVVGSQSAILTHGPVAQHSGKQDVTIGCYCYIGWGAIVLPGVTVADYCIVGAGSVVSRDVIEPRSVVVGNPACTVKRRDEEEIAQFVRRRKEDAVALRKLLEGGKE